jgi:hypothetical protein
MSRQAAATQQLLTNNSKTIFDYYVPLESFNQKERTR